MYEIPAGKDLKSELHIQLLGGFAISVGGVRIPQARWKSRRARNLVKLLALSPGQRLHRDQVIDTFWPNSGLSAAINNFHQTVYTARRVLEAHRAGGMILENGFLNLVASPVQVLQVDVEQFEAAAALAKDCQDPKAYQDALACYPGDLLPDDPYEEWTLQCRAALRQTFLQLLLDLARLHENRQEYPQGIALLQRLLSIDQCHEAAHAGLMRLYALSGQPQGAVRQYQALQEALRQELGLEPSHATTQLFAAIQSGRFSPVSPKSQPAHNLPVSLTPLVGRQEELEGLCLQLASPDCHLVTVFGPGGVGKTRLALEAGRTLRSVFADGVYLVEPDPQREGASLAAAIALAVGMPQVSDETTLVNYLAEKHLLLILDGLEHLLCEVDLIVRLLRHSSHLTILATSRARLNLQAERVFPVEGLSYPSGAAAEEDLERYGAVQLFLEAGQRADPRFQLTASNRQSVAEICRLTQGIPLGIVLAAAWCGVLEPGQIVREIRANLDFLALDGQDLPDRQRSLQATFDYSLRLLGENEQKVFLCLSVFHGPFSAGRARQVCGVTLHTLRNFLNQSLLIQASADRYVMHDLLRKFTQERLAADPAEDQAVHQRHCQVYLAALLVWQQELKSSAQLNALAEMDQEYGDIVAAWEWALAHGQIAQLEKTRDAFFYYHELRGRYPEMANLTGQWAVGVEKIEQSPEQLRLWVRLAAWQPRALTYRLKHDRTFQLIRQIEEQLARSWIPKADLCQELARVHRVKSRLILESGGNGLQALYEDQLCLEQAYASEDPWEIANALVWLAASHRFAGNIRETEQNARQALTILDAQEDPDPNTKSWALLFLANSYLQSGQYEAGLQLVQEYSAYKARFNDPRNLELSHLHLGYGLFYAGQFEQARSHLNQAMEFAIKAGFQQNIPQFLDFISLINVLTGDYFSVLEPIASAEDGSGASERAGMGPIAFGMACLMQGRYDQAEQEIKRYIDLMESLPRLDMIGFGKAVLACNDYCKGNLGEAKQHLQQALENAAAQGFYLVYLHSLALLARMLAEAGEVEQAVEVYATAACHPVTVNSKYFDDLFGRHIAERSRHLPAENVDAARARGRSMTLSQAGEKYLAKLKAAPDLLAFAHSQAPP